MQWQHGDFGCSLKVFHDLISLEITAYAKKAVIVNGIKYGKNDMRAYQNPDNVYWKAEIKGSGPALVVGKFDSKEEAMQEAKEKYKKLFADSTI